MSWWTYITGTILVTPLGRTQPEKRYILDTVLAHLPRVTGSEGNMEIYVNQRMGHDGSCSCDEFGQQSNLGDSRWSTDHFWFDTQSQYIITVVGSLRDRVFKETLKEFHNWLCRLSKRVMIDDVLVNVSGDDNLIVIDNYNDVYTNMFEDPSWCNPDEKPTWCEYLMYDKAKNSDFPMLLEYKYFNNEENDKEVERRMRYRMRD